MLQGRVGRLFGVDDSRDIGTQMFHAISEDEAYISVAQLEKFLHAGPPETLKSPLPLACKESSVDSKLKIPKSKPQQPPSTFTARKMLLRSPQASSATALPSKPSATLQSHVEVKASSSARSNLGAASPYEDKLRKDIRNHQGPIDLRTFLLLIFPSAKHTLVGTLVERLSKRHARASGTPIVVSRFHS